MIETLVIVIVLCVLALMVLPKLVHPPRRSPKIKCVNNLKNVGLAFRTFATDNNDRFPMQIPVANGGTREFINDPTLIWMHYAALSNELSTPKVLLCPSDILGRVEAKGFNRNYRSQDSVPFSANANLSYFLGPDSSETNPNGILAGDRNITNADKAPFSYGVARVGLLGTNHTDRAGAGWDHNVHEHAGNIALGDGSVHQVTTSRLRNALRSSGDPNNRIGVPD